MIDAHYALRASWSPGDLIFDEQLVKKYIHLADLVKVGPEGYIHGYICVRPPCGPKYKQTELDKKKGLVLHNGEKIGRVPSKDADGKYSAVHFSKDAAGVDVREKLPGRFDSPQQAFAVIAPYHNISVLRNDPGVNRSDNIQGHLEGARQALANADHENARADLKMAARAARNEGDEGLASHIDHIHAELADEPGIEPRPIGTPVAPPTYEPASGHSFAVGDRVEISLSDAGWVPGEIIAVNGRDVLVQTRRMAHWAPAAGPEARVRPDSSPTMVKPGTKSADPKAAALAALATDPKAFDEHLAEVHNRHAEASDRGARILDQIHRMAGDKKDTWQRGKPWGMTHQQAYDKLSQSVAAGHDERNLSSGKRPSDVLAEFRSARADMKNAKDEIAAHDNEYEKHRWSRFFPCKSVGGHIHSSLRCHTLRADTQMGWAPQLSGKTEEEAVNELDDALCSVCFPSAPVALHNYTSRRTQAERDARDAERAARNAVKDKKNLREEEQFRDASGSRVTTVAGAKTVFRDALDAQAYYPHVYERDKAEHERAVENAERVLQAREAANPGSGATAEEIAKIRENTRKRIDRERRGLGLAPMDWGTTSASMPPPEERVAGSDIAPLAKWEKHRDELTLLAQGDNARQDHVLERIAQLNGFDAKPGRGALDPGRPSVCRGFGDRYDQSNGAELAQQFTDGSYFGSTGIHGNGAYFTTSKDRAAGYGHVLEAQLKPSARVISQDEAWALADNAPPEWRSIIGGDPGRAAAMHGYDAIKTKGTAIIVLNRGALRVAED